MVTIAKAAIRHRGKIYEIDRPGRHHNIIAIIREKERSEGSEKESIPQDEQGFVTSDGEFVDRKRAARIALESGQIEKLNWPPSLYTEDLW